MTARASPNAKTIDYFGRVSRHRPTVLEVASTLKARAVFDGDAFAGELADEIENAVANYTACLVEAAKVIDRGLKLAPAGRLEFYTAPVEGAWSEMKRAETLRVIGASYLVAKAKEKEKEPS